MELTPENKKMIDSLNYRELLARWRSAPVGDEWFQGETGTYWSQRMTELKRQDPAEAVRASKDIGW